MATDNEKLYLVEKRYESKYGAVLGTPLVFRTRAKARTYAKTKNSLTRRHYYTVKQIKWGPEA